MSVQTMDDIRGAGRVGVDGAAQNSNHTPPARAIAKDRELFLLKTQKLDVDTF
jgi:hypothetical protein